MIILFCFSDAFDLEYGVGILRLKEGLSCEETDANESLPVNNSVHHKADPEGRCLTDSKCQHLY